MWTQLLLPRQSRLAAQAEQERKVTSMIGEMATTVSFAEYFQLIWVAVYVCKKQQAGQNAGKLAACSNNARSYCQVTPQLDVLTSQRSECKGS